MAAALEKEPASQVDASVSRPSIAICGEVSAGKSSVIKALLCMEELPDFFGIEDRPLLRIVTGAANDGVTVLRADGSVETLPSLDYLDPGPGMLEVHVTCTAKGPFGPCELVEMPPLRDGFVTEAQIERIAESDIMVWVTIGSQAWRLSEKSILDAIGDRRPAKRILVVSRADKFRSDTDRDRLIDRIERETADYFDSRVLLSAAPQSIEASTNDPSAWAGTGAKTLSDALGKAWTACATENVEQEAEDNDHVVAFVSQHAKNSREETVETQDPSGEAQEEPPETPEDVLAAFLETLHGVHAIGTVRLGAPDDVTLLAGTEEAARQFAAFSLKSAEVMLHIAGYGGMDPNPEAEHITTQSLQVLYRVKDGNVLFLACDSSKISAGIARTVFVRLTRLIDARSEP